MSAGDAPRRAPRPSRRALAFAAHAERRLRRARARLGVRRARRPAGAARGSGARARRCRLRRGERDGAAQARGCARSATRPTRESVNTLLFEDGRIVGLSTDAAVLEGLTLDASGDRRRRRRRARVRAALAARARVLAPRRLAAGRARRRPRGPRDARRATRCCSSCARDRRSSTCRTRRPRRRAAARAAGATVIDGLEVLVAQGAASFELWTGVPAPLDVMRNAVRSAP